MRIAISGRLLKPPIHDGIGYFIQQTLECMAENHPEDEFHILKDFRKDAPVKDRSNIYYHYCPPPARHPYLYLLHYNTSFRWKLKKINPDIVVAPEGFLPLNCPVDALAIIHDVGPRDFSGGVDNVTQWYYDRYLPKHISQAQRIATVSEFSKSRINDIYNVSNVNIDVVYSAVKKGYRPLGYHQQEEVRVKHAAGSPYLLYVGGLHPRKNVFGLIRAFEKIKNYQRRKLKLFIVGGKSWDNSREINIIKNSIYKKDIILSDYLELDTLQKITASAEMMVYPTFYEGFGVPPLESMAAGVPVISSDIPAIREISGDAALLIDTTNTDIIASTIGKVLNDDELKLEMVKRGFQKIKNYSWERTAGLLYDSITQAAR